MYNFCSVMFLDDLIHSLELWQFYKTDLRTIVKPRLEKIASSSNESSDNEHESVRLNLKTSGLVRKTESHSQMR